MTGEVNCIAIANSL